MAAPPPETVSAPPWTSGKPPRVASAPPSRLQPRGPAGIHLEPALGRPGPNRPAAVRPSTLARSRSYASSRWSPAPPRASPPSTGPRSAAAGDLHLRPELRRPSLFSLSSPPSAHLSFSLSQVRLLLPDPANLASPGATGVGNGPESDAAVQPQLLPTSFRRSLQAAAARPHWEEDNVVRIAGLVHVGGSASSPTAA